MILLRERSREQHISLVLRYAGLLALVVLLFWATFAVLMAIEGQPQPWWRGLYWTISTMTTLGLGDLVFTDMPGQLFTALVVVIGIIFMLVLLPLVLIQFPPWVEARTAARVRRKLSVETTGHVVITTHDPVSTELIRKLEQYHHEYVLLVEDVVEAVRLDDLGIHVMLGELDHPDTYRNARLEHAKLMVVTGPDIRNPNTVFTARGVTTDVTILATAKRSEAVGALELAGCNHVLQLSDMLGRALARRVIGGDALTHEIGRFDALRIAEATASRTPLVGKTLGETNLSELVSARVIGVWERGEFRLAHADTRIEAHTVLVLAGTREQLEEYDALLAIYNVSEDPVVVIGGGGVGQATARSLRRRGIDYRIIDRSGSVLRDERGIQGDAADLEVLERAGIARAPAAVITTHDDDTNVFLTLYCRRLRPEMQIVSRATYEKNVETLHRAGADFVVSLTSMGANAIFNVLERGEVLTVSEGLYLFKAGVPAELVGRTLGTSQLREETGCNVVALLEDGKVQVDPGPEQPLEEGATLVLIAPGESEQRFLERYGE
jgi:Trk K+ transport system NAD-binding subunit